MRIDMHIHTIYSPDGKVPIKDVLKIAKKIGLGGIAITDHNEIRGAIEAKKIGILPVVRGIEISTTEGHVLAYGLDCKIPRDMGIEETIDRIHDCGGIAVAAHPYRFWSGIGDENARNFEFDAIEIFNGRCKRKSNERAKNLVECLKKPYTAGSDAHFPDEIGKAGIIVDAADEEDVIEAILKKRVKIFGRSRSAWETVRYVKKAVGEWMGRGFKRI
ncbi:putative metal-dependent phosphoesterase, PHP family [Aciduliprofundum sp. MAR08-339]|uniref:PHP domain-containing protein n=1 Tax=Aciduliprofundum sp. (strain MAR08-339) TaxID=673860 RepID=UPI0002A4AF01|nr:putative metal-dependent phosphoesterase, PHP family [Aciduliprofundum sp. MAR08-339]